MKSKPSKHPSELARREPYIVNQDSRITIIHLFITVYDWYCLQFIRVLRQLSDCFLLLLVCFFLLEFLLLLFFLWLVLFLVCLFARLLVCSLVQSKNFLVFETRSAKSKWMNLLHVALNILKLETRYLPLVDATPFSTWPSLALTDCVSDGNVRYIFTNKTMTINPVFGILLYLFWPAFRALF